MDKTAFYKLTYGLYIVSAVADGKDFGCTVNTVAQVTAEPAQMSVAVNKNNATTRAILDSGYFAAAVLLQEATMELIGGFGFKSSRDVDKFAAFPHQRDKNGVAYVTEGVAALFSCKVVNSLDLGSHIMIIGEIEDALKLADGEVLTYGYYQTVKKGGTPKNAPSYKEEAPPAAKGFRCKVCGYIYEGEELPADFICPICGVGADQFEKL